MTWLIDDATVISLGTGWHAVEATCDGCGDRLYLLLDPDNDHLGDLTPPYHERTGPLPASVIAAINTPRCGGRRRDGRRCRTPVGRPGDRCHWHADQPVDQEATP